LSDEKTIPEFEPTPFDYWMADLLTDMIFHPKEEKKIKIFEDKKAPSAETLDA